VNRRWIRSRTEKSDVRCGSDRKTKKALAGEEKHEKKSEERKSFGNSASTKKGVTSEAMEEENCFWRLELKSGDRAKATSKKRVAKTEDPRSL